MILRQYEEDGYLITEYTRDGETVSTIIKELIPVETEPIPEPNPQPSMQEITESTLLETQYQTVLLELLSGF